MTTFDGFILTAFPPVAIMAILGICCIKKSCGDKSNCVLLFIVAIFLYMIAWRIPFVSDRRYVLPVIIPAILLAASFLKTLFQLKYPAGRWLCGVVLLIIAVTGTAKAMRFQEPKPYLTEIPALVEEELKTQSWEQVYVMILGNVGGYPKFSDAVTVTQILNSSDFSEQEDRDDIFKRIDLFYKPDDLLLSYPIMYILISSDYWQDNFTKIWESKYGSTPKLCYEFTRPKDKNEKIQLFRIASPYSSAYKSRKERLEFYRKFNLLPNPEFSQKSKIPADSPVAEQLTASGIKLTPPLERLLFPDGWKLYVGRIKKHSEAQINYTDQGFLALSGYVAFIQDAEPVDAKKIYQLCGCITFRDAASCFIMNTKFLGSKWKTYDLFLWQEQKPGRYEFSSLVDLSNQEGQWLIEFRLLTGKMEIEYLYLVEQSVFDQ